MQQKTVTRLRDGLVETMTETHRCKVLTRFRLDHIHRVLCSLVRDTLLSIGNYDEGN